MKRGWRRWTNEQIHEAAELYRGGFSTYECSSRLETHIPAMTLARYFQRMGIMRKHADSNRTARSRYLRSINPTMRQRGEHHWNWKGNRGGEQAGRMRARLLFPTPPEACIACHASHPHLHRHHRDRNTKNNSPENIQWLCPQCHIAQHPKTRDASGRVTGHA